MTGNEVLARTVNHADNGRSPAEPPSRPRNRKVLRTLALVVLLVIAGVLAWANWATVSKIFHGGDDQQLRAREEQASRRNLRRGAESTVQVLLNGVNTNTAAISQGYAETVIESYKRPKISRLYRSTRMGRGHDCATRSRKS